MNKKDDNNNKKIDYAKTYLNDLEEMRNNFYYYSPIYYALEKHHYLNRWLNEGYEMAKKRVIKNNVDYYLGILYYYHGFKEGHLAIYTFDESLVNRPFVDKSFNGTITYNIMNDKFYYLHDGVGEELLSVNKLPVKEYLNNYIIPYSKLDKECIDKVSYHLVAHKILHFNIMDKNDKTIKKLRLTCENNEYILEGIKATDCNFYLRTIENREYNVNSTEINHTYIDILFNKYMWLNLESFDSRTLEKTEIINIKNDINKKLNGIETIFIDLRANEGGNFEFIYSLLYNIFNNFINLNVLEINEIIRNTRNKEFNYTNNIQKFDNNRPILNTRNKLKIVVLISTCSYSACNIFLKFISVYKNVFIYGHISKETYLFPARKTTEIRKSKSGLSHYYVPSTILFIKSNNNEDIELKSRLLPSKFIYNRYIKNNHSQIELLMWLLNDIKENISL